MALDEQRLRTLIERLEVLLGDRGGRADPTMPQKAVTNADLGGIKNFMVQARQVIDDLNAAVEALPGGALGTMAAQNANNVAITGGTIGGVVIGRVLNTPSIILPFTPSPPTAEDGIFYFEYQDDTHFRVYMRGADSVLRKATITVA